MSEKNSITAGCAFTIIMGIYGLVLLYAAFVGLHHHIGWGWGVGIVIVGLIFKIWFPVAIAAFFGAMNVWGWPWLGALLFAAPGFLGTVIWTLVGLGAVAYGGRASNADP